MATTITQKTERFVKRCLTMADDMVKLSARQVWIDYDEEADMLYMSYRKPQATARSQEVGSRVT